MNQSSPYLDRVFIQIGSLPIYWYGVIIVSGMIIGSWIATREAVKRGLDKNIFFDLLLYAIPISIICARAYYVLFELSYYLKNPAAIIDIRQGGLAIHGGLIGAVLTAIIFSKKRGVSFFKLADIAAPSIILGQAIGRWGNFMNQEAHGGPVSLSFLENLHLPRFIINQMYINGQYYQPTFLYESIWNIVGFILLMFLRKVNLKRGELFFTYLIWYAIGRYFIEGMRTDSLKLGDIRIAQLVSILLIITSVVFVYIRRFKLKTVKNYRDNS